jgi:hypothetical protein
MATLADPVQHLHLPQPGNSCACSCHDKTPKNTRRWTCHTQSWDECARRGAPKALTHSLLTATKQKRPWKRTVNAWPERLPQFNQVHGECGEWSRMYRSCVCCVYCMDVAATIPQSRQPLVNLSPQPPPSHAEREAPADTLSLEGLDTTHTTKQAAASCREFICTQATALHSRQQRATHSTSTRPNMQHQHHRWTGINTHMPNV